MSDRPWGRLAARLTLLKLRRSPAILAVSLTLPALTVFVWVKASYGAGLRTFLFLLPHAFLFATQNMFKGEAAGGALENVLFAGGGFRRYFLWKNAVLALAGSGYGIFVYAAVRAVGPSLPERGTEGLYSLAASLIAGVYFIALGGTLGHFFEGGSNVLVLIIAQAAAFIGLIQDAASGHSFLESLASGTVSGPSELLRFAALAAVLPNILVSASLRRFAIWLLPAAAVLLLFQALIVRGSESRGR
jgi:hypothetical protein